MSGLAEIWTAMGFIRYPLGFSLLAVLALSCWSGIRLLESEVGPGLRTKAWIDAILFWGGFALIAGVLGTLLGIIIAAQSIEYAGTVEPSLVWGGVKVAMLSSAFGTLILAMAALSWFLLQLRWRFLVADLESGL